MPYRRFLLLVVLLTATLVSPTLISPTLSAAEPQQDESNLYEQLQRFDAEIQQQLTEVRNNATTDGTATEQRLEAWQAALRDFDARLEALATAGLQRRGTDRTWQRKLDSVRLLRENLQRAVRLSTAGDVESLRFLRSTAQADVALPTSLSAQPDKAQAPANDTCKDALLLSLGTVVQGTLAEASADGQSSCTGSPESPDAWFRYTALEDDYVVFDSSGSSFDTTVSIHTSCPGLASNELVCSDDSYGLQGAAMTRLRPGQEVWVRLSGFTPDVGDGVYRLHVSAPPTISGRVVSDPGGQPLRVGTLLCSSEGGFLVQTATTADDGTFRFGRPFRDLIGPASYYVHTYDSRRLGYVGEVYDDIVRPDDAYIACNEPEGTKIELRGGDHVEGIEMALSRGGSVSGRVHQVDGRGVTARIHAYDASGRPLGWTVSNVHGYYTLGGLPAGDLFFQAFPRNPIDSVIYDAIPCGLSCSPTDGTPVAVSLGQTTSGIDFQAPGGPTLRGTVTREDGTPLEDAIVRAYRGDLLLSPRAVRSAEDGSYAFHDLDPVAYFVEASATRYVTEIYEDLACGSNCDFTQARVVDLHQADDVVIDFELGLAAGSQPTLTGTISDRNSGAPIHSVEVRAYDPVNDQGYTSFTGLDGSFRMTVAPNRTYHLYTKAPATHENQVLGGEVCPHYDNAGRPTRDGCDPLRAVPVSPGTGSVASLDFQLRSLPRIQGRVTDIAGRPMENVSVVACNETDLDFCLTFPNGSAATDELGAYVLPVPPGDHFVLFFGPIHLHVYGAAPCPDEDGEPCSTAGAQQLHVETSDIDNIDIRALARGAVRGRVLDAAGRLVTQGEVWLWSVSEQRRLARALLNGSGAFSFSHLLAGDHEYQVFTETPNWQDQVYDGIACEGNCPGTGGTIFSFSGEAVVQDGVEFVLQQQPALSGRVLDAASGEPVDRAAVNLWDSTASLTNFSAFTGNDGRFLLEGVEPGTYFLTATANGFFGQVHGGDRCEGVDSCSVPAILRGDRLAIATGDTLTGLDLDLTPNSSITGRVSEALTDRGISTTIRIFAASGQIVDTVNASAFSNGEYRSRALPTGTYFVSAGSTSSAYEPTFYDGVGCPNGIGQPPCENPASVATPVTVQARETTTGIDFVLPPRASGIWGSVEAAGGQSLVGVRIDAWDAYTGAYAGHAFTQPGGSFSLSLPPSSYFVTTHNQLGLVDEVHRGVACPDGSALQGRCAPRLGTPVAALGRDFTSVNFILGQPRTSRTPTADGARPGSPRQQGASVEGTVRSRTGQPLAGIEVERGDERGSLIDTTVTDADGRYRFSGLDAGIYVFDARSPAGSTPYVEQSFDGVDCEPWCTGSIGFDQRRGTQVPVTADASIGGIDFRLLLGGRIAGRVFDAVTGNSIGSASVTLYSADGSWSRALAVDAQGHYETPALPPGLYKLTTYNKGHETQLFDNQPCPVDPDVPNRLSCNVFTGTQVRVRPGMTTRSVDFPLRPNGRIHGQIFDLETGQPLPWQFLRLERPGDAPIHVRSGRGGHFSFSGLTNGTYYLGSDVDRNLLASDYANVLHAGLVCRELCKFDKGSPIPIEVQSDVRIDLHLPHLPLRLFGSVRNAASGAPLAGIEVNVHDIAGAFAGTTTTLPDGSYRLDVPPGQYRVSTRNILGFLDQAYPGQECAGSCEPTAGTPLTLDFETGQRADFELRSVLEP